MIVLCICTTHADAAHQAQSCPLSDGVLLRSAQGNLVKHVKESNWSFLMKQDSVVGQVRLKAGMRFPLLHNAMFEAMLADRQEHPHATYWLWARVTRYKDRNYLFPLNFVPLQQADDPADDQSNEPNDIPDTAAQEPASGDVKQEDRLNIPDFIKAQRQGPSVVRTRTAPTYAAIKPNRVVSDRMGYIKQQADGPVFVYDGLGQNRQVTQLRLLPCALLESMEHQQARNPDRLYFRIAGVQTLYQGQPYLLLRRIRRAYSHGNFKR